MKSIYSVTGEAVKSADYTRTCEGCRHVRVELWARGEIGYRCFAPGAHQGYHIGTGRFLPYVPAWCPEKLKRVDYGTEKPVSRQVKQL